MKKNLHKRSAAMAAQLLASLFFRTGSAERRLFACKTLIFNNPPFDLYKITLGVQESLPGQDVLQGLTLSLLRVPCLHSPCSGKNK